MKIEDIIKQECQKIKTSDGLIKPQALVDISRPEDAPLHNQFEWDDSKAAEEYRLNQARHLIVRVQFEERETVGPMFINVKFETSSGVEQGYMPITTVMATKTLREQAINEALREIRYWQEKYGKYEELSKIINQEEFQRLTETVS